MFHYEMKKFQLTKNLCRLLNKYNLRILSFSDAQGFHLLDYSQYHSSDNVPKHWHFSSLEDIEKWLIIKDKESTS